MQTYKVNFKRLALLLLPTFMRKQALGNLAMVISSPVRRLHMDFTWFRNDTNNILAFNGQTCYLRGLLNNIFDPIERRITITEPGDEEVVGTTVYLRETDIELVTPMRESGMAILIDRRGSSGINAIDIWINLPPALVEKIDMTRLHIIVNMYKLASRRYAINTKKI